MFETGVPAADSPPIYRKGDIVWVKLSGYWWPGEVKHEEDLPGDLVADFKRPPLVIVKFFEEDSYEYIKQWSHIYPYNCDKKIEFIKKGMAGFRAKHAHLTKFPKDIGTAEEKTNGDPNILSQPEFLPNKKINIEEIFGTPSPKKTKGKTSLSSSKKSAVKDNYSQPLITHRRFLGNDDYQAFICENIAQKCNSTSDNEAETISEEPPAPLICKPCSFVTNRIGVLRMHRRRHLDGMLVSKKKIKKPKEELLSDSELEVTEVKRPTPKPRKKPIKVKLQPKKEDFANLLEDWSDTDEEIGAIKTPLKAKKTIDKENNDLIEETQGGKPADKHKNSEGLKVPKGASNNKNTQDDIKNCFDFDEEEEEDEFLAPASVGRKIPRVIPEKPKASITELMELSDKEEENAEKELEDSSLKKEVLGNNQSQNTNTDDNLEATFKELMDETSVPPLDDLNQSLKPEQNFHDARTIKFPDKGGTSAASLKSGISRKRFITSFDDFEAGFRKIQDEELGVDFKQGKIVNDSPSSSPEKKMVADPDASKEPQPEKEGRAEEGPPAEEPSVLTVSKNKPKKKTRRITKQLLIDDNSEQIITFSKEVGNDVLIEEIENTVDGNTTNDSATSDAEIEAIKKNLETSQGSDNALKEGSEQSEMSLEQLTRELEGTDDVTTHEKSVEANAKKSRASKTKEDSKNTPTDSEFLIKTRRGRSRALQDEQIEVSRSSQSDVDTLNVDSNCEVENRSKENSKIETLDTLEKQADLVQSTPRRGRSKKLEPESVLHEEKLTASVKSKKGNKQVDPLPEIPEPDTEDSLNIQKNEIIKEISPAVDEAKSEQDIVNKLDNADTPASLEPAETPSTKRKRGKSRWNPEEVPRRRGRSQFHIETEPAKPEAILTATVIPEHVPEPFDNNKIIKESENAKEDESIKQASIDEIQDISQIPLPEECQNKSEKFDTEPTTPKLRRGRSQHIESTFENLEIKPKKKAAKTDSGKSKIEEEKPQEEKVCTTTEETSDKAETIPDPATVQIKTRSRAKESEMEVDQPKAEIDVAEAMGDQEKCRKRRTRRESKALASAEALALPESDSQNEDKRQEISDVSSQMTGIVCDVTYDRKTRTSRSKASKSRWDVVPDAETNLKDANVAASEIGPTQDLSVSEISNTKDGEEQKQTTSASEPDNTETKSETTANVPETINATDNSLEIIHSNSTEAGKDTVEPIPTETEPSNLNKSFEGDRASSEISQIHNTNEILLPKMGPNEIFEIVGAQNYAPIPNASVESSVQNIISKSEPQISTRASLKKGKRRGRKFLKLKRPIKKVDLNLKNVTESINEAANTEILSEKEKEEAVLVEKSSESCESICDETTISQSPEPQSLQNVSEPSEKSASLEDLKRETEDAGISVSNDMKNSESSTHPKGELTEEVMISIDNKEKQENKKQNADKIDSKETTLPVPAKVNAELAEQPTKLQAKSMPLKKNKWPREGSSCSKNQESNKELEKLVIEKTDLPPTKTNEDENELILPLKKSRRVNEVAITSEKQSELSFFTDDESFLSTSLKNNIEGLITDIDNIDNSTTENLDAIVSSDIAFVGTDIEKCIPPKKKKIELPKEVNVPFNHQAETVAKTEDKSAECFAQSPKKKMQKLFENSQALEKADIPLMSPLAKKKSFLFQRDFDQSETIEDEAGIGQKRKSPSTSDISTKNSKPCEEASQNVSLTEEKLIPDNVASLLSETSSELVAISVAPTVISEKDLTDDAQVEITTDKVISEKKGTFSKAPTLKTDDAKRIAINKPNMLKSELLDILEGSSNSSTNSSGSEHKFKMSYDNYDKKTTVEGIIDFEDAIPSQIVLSNKVTPESVLMDSPKLLERLSMSTDKTKKVAVETKVPDVATPKIVIKKAPKSAIVVPRPGQKLIIRSPKPVAGSSLKPTGCKPIILSEQIIRPATAIVTTSQGVKRQYEDVEDVEAAFIIPKVAKKVAEEEVPAPAGAEKTPVRARSLKTGGKAKILQQTIITPKGEIIPETSTTQVGQLKPVPAKQQEDNAMFDINSMPIVLSDDLLTPESFQSMPAVLSEDLQQPAAKQPATPASKKFVSIVGAKQIIFKTATPSASSIPLPLKAGSAAKPKMTVPAQSKLSKLGTATAFVATGTSADGKFVLMPPSLNQAQVKTIKQAVVKKQPLLQSNVAPASTASDPVQSPVGNKIMIMTNTHGRQTRLLLTPQQQKVFMQTKTVIKGSIPKGLLESSIVAGPSGTNVKPTQTTVALSAVPTQSAIGKALMTPKKAIGQRAPAKTQRTILIKNQLGQTVKKIQGTDDDDLERRVAEQIEAIKASTKLQQASKSPEIINYTNRSIPSSSKPPANRKSYIKKQEPVKSKIPVSAIQEELKKRQEVGVAASTPMTNQLRTPQIQASSKLSTAPIKRAQEVSVRGQVAEASPQQQKHSAKQETNTEAESKSQESSLKQVVIQDGQGNLITVNVGQILAIPSETVDGQPQSYMLVTVDESGNFSALNNDALMSLDPNLTVAGDVNNMVLQVDQSQGTITTAKTALNVPATSADKPKLEEKSKPESHKPVPLVKEVPKQVPVEQPKLVEMPSAVEQQVVIGEGVIPGDSGGQQLIVTGDPAATQKFLESLSDGSTDLASILASAEGGSVLIQADGQSILVRTNTAVPPALGLPEPVEDNSMFATHKPNQDILAAALANTEVFQPTDPTNSNIVKGLSSAQLSPSGGALFPMHSSNVLETSLTLSSPIMTPLEVPSTNTKKIDDEADILSQVPKNVDLPITITDPNISQTVAHQQVAGLMELTLPIPEPYSLSTLEESAGISQKSFNTSMPLLTDDEAEERISKGMKKSPGSPNFGSLPMIETLESSREEVVKTTTFEDIGSLPLLTDDMIEDSRSSIESAKLQRTSPKRSEHDIEDEGLSTLEGEMCSSLSEPPPDMFDLSSIAQKDEEISSDISSIPEPETLSLTSENSEEIPLQPPIVANLRDLKRSGDEDSEGSDEKRHRSD